ncbi:MAG: tetratricopeptide repeat protein [Halopseudomonas sp.]
MQSVPSLPPDLQQALQMAFEFRKAGRPAEAERIYRDCMARHPRQPMLLGQMGELLLQNGDGRSALPLLEQARQLAPGHAPFWLLETQCLLALDRPKEAKKVISEAIRKGLRHPLADELLAKARSRSAPTGKPVSLKESLRQLDALFRARRFSEAESQAREVLRHHAKSPHVWYLLGMAIISQGRLDESVEPFRCALKHDPTLAPASINLGFALERLNRLDEALEAYRWTVKADPQMADAYNNMGNVLQKLVWHEEALAAYDRAIALAPRSAPFRMNRGDALRDLERLDEAVAAYREAVAIQLDLVEAYISLAYVLAQLERHEESIVVCRRAIERRPEAVEVYHSMGKELRQLSRDEEAADTYRQLIAMRPDDVRAYMGLAEALHSGANYDGALKALEQVLKVDPQLVSAIDMKAGVLLDMGCLEDALGAYRQALEIGPEESFSTHSNLLLAMNYQAGATPVTLLAEAEAFGAKAARKAKPWGRHDNLPDPDRRLRIGFVSADLGRHPVGFFLENVLQSLDPEKLELFAYATADRRDPLNTRLRHYIPHWCDARDAKQKDEALASKIRTDGIDILIDLAGHTGKNRLPVFAWKPAPVQVSWLGYLGTTGLDAIDYVLADKWALPHGEEDQFTETPWRLPESYICFSPPDLSVEVGQLPALGKGHVTFGCFNNLNKVTDHVIECWARILEKVPGATLFLKTKSLGAVNVREKIVGAFSRHGIAPERLVMDGQFASHEDHFRAYYTVDIALDPFPYPGITTTVEALWMGVPVVSLKGDRFISHQGETILNNVGLPQWIAADEDDYIAKAVSFAADLPALASLRAGLREQLLASPLCDAPRFARNLEEALRGMWRIWCEKQQAV